MAYRVYADDVLICSSNAEDTALATATVTLEANNAGSFVFTMLPDHMAYDLIQLRSTMIDVYQDDELIFEGIATEEKTDFLNRKTVTCEGDLTFLNDSIQRQARYTNQSVTSLLQAYLNVHNAQVDADRRFTRGIIAVDGGSSLLRYTNYQTTMTEIAEDLIDNFGGYLRVRHANGVRYLDYLAESPRTSSQVIKIGSNLIDLSKNLSSLDICTVLIPLGCKLEEPEVEGLEARLTVKSVNSGRDYIVGTASAYYGNIWRTNIWDDVTNATNLLTKGRSYLEDAQWANLVIEASAVDLGLSVENVEQFRVLDMIRVISEPHGINREFILTKLKIDLNNPGNTQITLGEDQNVPLSKKSAQTSREIREVDTRIDGAVEQAKINAKQILENSTDGNVYFRYDSNTGKLYEIDILNTNSPETATKMWRWNMGGFAYSGDGGQTYGTAITMDGTILGNYIAANSVSVSKLTGNISGGNNWSIDLDHGTMSIGDISANNITAGTITGNVTATNFTMTGGRIDIETSSSNDDRISLRYGYQRSILSAYYLSFIDNYSLYESSIFGSRFLIEKRKNSSLDSETYTRIDINGGSDGGDIMFFNKNQQMVPIIDIDAGLNQGTTNLVPRIIFRDPSNGNERMRLDKNGLVFTDASGNNISGEFIPTIVSSRGTEHSIKLGSSTYLDAQNVVGFKGTLSSGEDLNSYRDKWDSGIYYVGSGVTNAPANYGMLIIIGTATTGNGVCRQLFVIGPDIYARGYTGSGTNWSWSSWYRYTGTAI